MSRTASFALFVCIFTPIHAGLSLFAGFWAYSEYGKPGGDFSYAFAMVLLSPMMEIAKALPEGIRAKNQTGFLVLNSLIWALSFSGLWSFFQRRKRASPGFTINVEQD